ncbi:MAG: regulatory protein RecX [Eggerthellaceae bacterium]|nr:regulatory protein RecX [Eggerthellaceae bacterium]
MLYSSSNSFLALASDEGQKVWAKILRTASAREYSTKQVRVKLRNAGYSENVIEEAIERAQELKILDDERYADSLIRTRISSGKGLQPTLKEIEELGINPETLPSFEELAGIDAKESELERALVLLDRKPPRSKNLRDGAFRKLVQAGYSVEVAGRAARLWMENGVE